MNDIQQGQNEEEITEEVEAEKEELHVFTLNLLSRGKERMKYKVRNTSSFVHQVVFRQSRTRARKVRLNLVNGRSVTTKGENERHFASSHRSEWI